MPRPFLAIVLVPLVMLAGCTGARLLPAPAQPQIELARIAGMPENAHIRFWGDKPLDVSDGEPASHFGATNSGQNHYDVLALSGGGPDGAYGAGLLNGWSDRDTETPGPVRPEFDLVTGISVGALIAPFAFLGPDYDDELAHLFIASATANVVHLTLFDALFGYSLGLTDIRPLQAMLDQIVTPQLVRRIAEEYRSGRQLWIGTTYLDAERPVIWDIGAIAVSDYREKSELIRKILLASAAIPGAFPPVEFRVEIDGRLYSEMHVDGSITQQLFVGPGNVAPEEARDMLVPGQETGTIYLVRNGKILPNFEPVAPSLPAILKRSLFTLTNALAIGDVGNIRRQAHSEGWHLMISAVPRSFDVQSTTFFDPKYMSALYRTGYERAINGTAWTVLNDPNGTTPPAPIRPIPKASPWRHGPTAMRETGQS